MPTSVDLCTAPSKNAANATRPSLPQPRVDPLHEDVDRRVVVANVLRPVVGELLLEHPAERAHQVPQLDLVDRLLVRLDGAAGQVARHPRIALAPLAAPLLEHAGRVAVLLELQQPADQLLPRILELLLDLVVAAAAPSAT